MINYLYYIKKRLSGQRGLLLNISVSSLALALLCVVAAVPQILLHCEGTIRKALADDISKYGVVLNSADTMRNEAASDYIDALYNAPEIESVGTWDYYGWGYLTTVGAEEDYWNEILEIQNRHNKKFDMDSDAVRCIYMLSQAFHFNNLELYRGDVEQIGTNQEYLLYLGYHFKDIPVGTKFVDEIYGNSYVVEGILKKNVSVIDAHLLWNLGGFRLNCSDVMDNFVLVVPPSSMNYYSVNYFFKCSDGYTYEEASNKIKDISEKYGIQADTGSLRKRVDTVLSDSDWLLKAVDQLAILLFLSAFIMLLTTQLLTILFRKDEMGVWLISGIDRKAIFRILLGENIIKMMISSLIALGIVVLFEKVFISSSAVAYELRYILWVNLPIFLILSAVLTALLCSVIPIVYVRTKSIPEIVRGTWD